ncbi:MAG: Carbon monoxide dehydrogenase 2 [Syntrophomonadaceae bacterium]|nr:Carbon monoxide dehydrogenase 2 [Bacillota bacterium]
MQWVVNVLPVKRIELFKEKLLPAGIDHEIAEIMHRTAMGCDADATNILLGALRCALADLAGCNMGTDLSDIFFGTPQPKITECNLGVIKAQCVNIAVHGHNPVLSEVILAASHQMDEEAKQAGAERINVVGICCTGNEVLMRHGVPSCTHSVSQEMAFMTGALDAMVRLSVRPSVAGDYGCLHRRHCDYHDGDCQNYWSYTC